MLSARDIHTIPAKMKIPTLIAKIRVASGESEVRIGKRPRTTAARTTTKTNIIVAIKNQSMPMHMAASQTAALLGLFKEGISAARS